MPPTLTEEPAMQLTDIRIRQIVETDGLPSHALGTATFDNGYVYEFHANFAHGYGDESVIITGPADRRRKPANTPALAEAIRNRLNFNDIAARERKAIATFEWERVAACRALLAPPRR